jgi:hypothetical protein
LAISGSCDKDPNPFSQFRLVIARRHGGSPQPLPKSSSDPPERAAHDATINSPLAFSNLIIWYQADALLLPMCIGHSINVYRRTLDGVSSATQGTGRSDAAIRVNPRYLRNRRWMVGRTCDLALHCGTAGRRRAARPSDVGRRFWLHARRERVLRAIFLRAARAVSIRSTRFELSSA